MPWTPELITLSRHAVCLGATGSGKTGMYLSIVEHAARRGVPVVMIDPKGDGINLALVPPSDDPTWFAAHRPDDPAAGFAEGERWLRSLAEGGRTLAEREDWHARVSVRILTPGSDAAPVDLVSALLARPASDDPDDHARAVSASAASLLSLVGRPAHPFRDAEAGLLAQILHDAWQAGEGLDLGTLIARVARPPFATYGQYATDEALPPDDRQALALALNQVVASPTFAAWRRGEPLDLRAWTQPTADRRTPVTVISLGHLSDAERTFFLTTFLHALVGYTRTLPGSDRLRALVVIDELYGYLPPHPKDPPTKAPLLMLLKQARAVGVGLLLAAQNALDLDHKALANCGTWIVGQLRTAHDRRRVAEGMELPDLDATIASLAPRSFVVRDPRGQVSVVRSPHTLSWLRGPLTPAELRRLVPATASAPSLPAPPVVPAGVDVAWAAESAEAWEPALYAVLHLTWDDGPPETWHRLWRPLALTVAPTDTALPALHHSPLPGRYAPLPAFCDTARELLATRAAVEADARQPVPGWYDPLSERFSRPGEDAATFAARVGASDEPRPTPIRPAVTVGWFGVVWMPTHP